MLGALAADEEPVGELTGVTAAPAAGLTLPVLPVLTAGKAAAVPDTGTGMLAAAADIIRGGGMGNPG